ncbi:hypothetical protein ACX1EY_14255 [Legionella pneumophila]
MLSHKYPLDYNSWLGHFRNEFENLYKQLEQLLPVKSIDTEAEVKAIFERLYYCLTHLVEANLTIDMGPVKPIIFSCKYLEREDRKTFVVVCNLNNIEKLHLYMFPNTTPCPRFLAFIKTLEEVIN